MAHKCTNIDIVNTKHRGLQRDGASNSTHSFPVKEQTYQADDVDKNPRIRDCNFGSSFSISLLKIGEIDTRHEQKLPTGVLLHVED